MESVQIVRSAVAVVVAGAVAVVIGVSLAYIEGWEYHESPVRSYPTLTEEALRYNRTNKQDSAEILLLGSSLMRLGVLEDQLARDLAQPDLDVINLAMDGAGPWEQLRLVRRLAPPRCAGPKLAIVEVNREAFAARRSDDSYADAAMAAVAARSDHRSVTNWVRAKKFYAVPERQEFADWVQEFRFGFLARWFPSLVPTPNVPRRKLWDVGVMEQRRAVRAMTPLIAAQNLRHWRLSETSLLALHDLVGELKRRGFRVMLLQTPTHTAYLSYWDRSPDDSLAQTVWKERVLTPSSTGADAVLAIDAAAMLGASDSIFIDYAHMTKAGAILQTNYLASFIRAASLLSSPAYVQAPSQGALRRVHTASN